MICLIDNCCGHGDYIEPICYCDAGWYENDCHSNIKEKWQMAYFTYFGFFISSFFIMGVFSVRILLLHIKDKQELNHYSRCRLVRTIMSSPVNVAVILCLILCIVKVVWLAIDPFQVNDLLDRVYERLLAEVVYSFLFATYAILLIVFYTLYDEVSFNVEDTTKLGARRYICSYYKFFVKFRIIMVFIIQIATSTVKGLRYESQYRYYIYAAYGLLYINFIFFILEFAVYGSELYKCINFQLKQNIETFMSRKDTNSYEYKNQIIKIKSIDNTELVIINSDNTNPQQDILLDLSIPPILDISPQQQTYPEAEVSDISLKNATVIQKKPKMLVSQSFRKPNDIKPMFRQDSFSKQKKNTVLHQANQPLQQSDLQKRDNPQQILFLNRTSFYIEENEQVVEWVCVRSNEIAEVKEKQALMIRDLKKQYKATQNKSPNSVTLYQRQDHQYLDQEKRVAQEELRTVVQTKFQVKREHLNLDLKVLYQIMLLTVSGVILEICFAILSIVVYATRQEQSAVGILVTLYIVGVLELLSLMMVLRLFQNIKSKEVENLIWIKKLGSKIKKINQKFTFQMPDRLKDSDQQQQKFENRINQN